MSDLLTLTEIFLTSSTILIGSFAIARTEALKTGLSIVGIALTVLWMVCTVDVKCRTPASTTTSVIAFWLPLLFMCAWFISAIVHARLWLKEPNRVTGSVNPPGLPTTGRAGPHQAVP